MPGIVVFQRRWSVGSDDFVLPAIFLLSLHVIWALVLACIIGIVDLAPDQQCMIGHINLSHYVLGSLVILSANILVEGLVFWVSMRGTILDPSPRECMQYLLYARLVLLLVELAWQIIGVMWMSKFYQTCTSEKMEIPKKAALGVITCNWGIMLLVIILVWCTYDIAGRKWVKMKRYQESLKEKSHRNKRNSGRRNWRQRSSFVRLLSVYSNMRRKAIRAYEESWDRRFQMLCCCVEREGTNRNSIAEIAKLFTEFFRDLDVVPSDVIAGFVLLRRYQKLRMQHIVTEGSNDVYQYLSGVPVTPRTEFLQLGQPEVLEEYKLVVHYMRYALAAYGWPAFMMMHTGTGLCKMLPGLRCCCCCPCCGSSHPKDLEIIDDNCCMCNFTAMLKLSGLTETDVAYVTYHVDIGETPFFVAVDHQYKKVVLCVRGTLSLQDVLTDLKADAENLPLEPVKEDWVGHKGMVQAAVYIQKKLKEDRILARGFALDPERGTQNYDLVLVGHSLGAGTAAILAILLHPEYPSLHCYSFSPPGGLLSDVCVEETKSFITSVVVGKDVVPRIGLSQLEVLRTDLINVIKSSSQPKWKIISKGLCCGSKEADKMKLEDISVEIDRDITAHPLDSQIGLSTHRPLYPPGKIIHVVRSHPKGKRRKICGSAEPVFQAIWAHNTDFDEVIVSPTMINDHMPDKVMAALEKVLVNIAPPKPNRTLTEEERKAFLEKRSPSMASDEHRLIVAEDFTIRNAQNQIPLQVPNQHQNQYSAPLPPLFSWDHAADETKFLLEKDNGHAIHDEYPRKPPLVLDLGLCEPIAAPLASPETLSEISSVSSISRSSSLTKEQKRKSMQSPQVLETIQQSPVSKTRGNDFGSEPNGHIKNDGVKCSEPIINNNIKADIVVENIPQKPYIDEENAHNVTTDLTVPLLSDYSSNNCVHIIGNGTCDGTYDRHSPVDGNQSEYGNPNTHYSAAGIGYPHGSGAYHPPIKLEPPDQLVNVSLPADNPLKVSQSESQLEKLSAKYVMRRSTEQRDIAHLQDNIEVFTGEEESNPSTHRSRLMPAAHTPITSDGTQASTNSLEDDSERRLSSSHSDDVFDLPLEETDV